MIQCNYERMEDKIKTFSRFGDTGRGGITRFSLSEEALAARKEFVKRMEQSVLSLQQTIWQIYMQPLTEQKICLP